jgi:hypothetical protein
MPGSAEARASLRPARRPVSADQPAASVTVVNLEAPPTAIGVGIDTSRYGHHATFLRADLQPAAEDLDFAESAASYEQLRQRLETIAQRHAAVHFHFRLDVAGAYADNLLAFLQRLSWTKTISCGDPQRNKNYRSALYGHKKSDPVESAAVARYAGDVIDLWAALKNLPLREALLTWSAPSPWNPHLQPEQRRGTLEERLEERLRQLCE